MSNATLAVYGRLGSDPREHETRKGGAMATASLAVNVPDRSRDADEGAEATLWLVAGLAQAATERTLRAP